MKPQGLICPVPEASTTVFAEMLGRKVEIESKLSISDLFLLHLGQHLNIFLVHVRLGERIEDLLIFVFLFHLADSELLLYLLIFLEVLFLTNI